MRDHSVFWLRAILSCVVALLVLNGIFAVLWIPGVNCRREKQSVADAVLSGTGSIRRRKCNGVRNETCFRVLFSNIPPFPRGKPVLHKTWNFLPPMRSGEQHKKVGGLRRIPSKMHFSLKRISERKPSAPLRWEGQGSTETVLSLLPDRKNRGSRTCVEAAILCFRREKQGQKISQTVDASSSTDSVSADPQLGQ